MKTNTMEIDRHEIKGLLESIKFVYGYDFTEYAESSINRRIVHFINSRKIENLATLGKMILLDEVLFEAFIQELSVTVTDMFRDPFFYKSLRQQIRNRLATYPFIKIWVAGCATGEEVYSIAILLHEEGLLNRAVIYATDINQRSLQIAKEGIYTVGMVEKFADNYRKSGGEKDFSQYYNEKYESIIFNKVLKENIVFSSHNLSVDKSFNEFQLIICRNVMIYFNQQLQNKVINLFYDSLCIFGFLALGSKESLLFSEKRKYFDEVARREKIFIKIK